LLFLKRKMVSSITLTLLLTGMLTLAFNIQSVRASGTIYIRADGSIDPSTALISTVDNVTYTFTDSINDSIVIERDDIVVDGTGYALQGTNASGSIGADVTGKSNITIKNMTIRAFYYGIYLDSSSNNSISGNNITANNYSGILLYYSSSNSISGNNMTGNNDGIEFYFSSSYNSFFHNNFINNAQQVFSLDSMNVWDDGYPSGGNYWSDYTGTDGFRGPFQNETGSDGIGDTPYGIDQSNIDHYPLMHLWVRLRGDINGDGVVDIYDAILLANAYNSARGKVNWNPDADINGDNIVDIYDAIILANHYNQHYP